MACPRTLITLTLWQIGTIAAAAEYIPLGVPPGEIAIFAEAVSADGTYVVGRVDRLKSQSFRWSSANGMETLGPLPGDYTHSGAHNISGDGRTVVGGLKTDGSEVAYQWTSESGFTELGLLPGLPHSLATDISTDGSTIIGNGNNGFDVYRAFKWNMSEGIEGLGTLRPGDISFANGVSSDGSVIVGHSGVDDDVLGFRWTEESGMAALEPLPGNSGSFAQAISADGSVIVGDSSRVTTPGEALHFRAVRWIEGIGIQSLGTLPGYEYSTASLVSADGSVILGFSQSSSNPQDEAYFIWSATEGMRHLDDMLNDAGLHLPPGTLYRVNDLSDDGNAIVGYSRSPLGVEEAWLIRLDSVTVPEPLGIILAGIAITALSTFRSAQNAGRRRQDTSPPYTSVCPIPLDGVRRASVTTIIAALLCCSAAYAKKPGNPGGGKPGGGDAGGNELQLVDLHPFSGGTGRAFDINNAGIVVGKVDDIAGVWDASATTPTFSALSGTAWAATAVNDDGAIVGHGSGPIYWASPSSNPISLPLPPGSTSGSAYGISNDGVVVGIVTNGDSDSAVAWRVTEVSVFGPVMLSIGSAYDVATTSAGTNRIVGSSVAGPGGSAVATAWDLVLHSGGSFTLSSSTTLIPGQTSEAFAITGQGDISGVVYGFDRHDAPDDHAFVIRSDSLELLPSGGRHHYGAGYDLNDTQVVGVTAQHFLSSEHYATLWNSNDKSEDLMRSYFDDSWSWAIAQGINDRGDIVGFGSRNSEGHAWLLRSTTMTNSTASAIPEPTTAALLFMASVLAIMAKLRAGLRAASELVFRTRWIAHAI